MKKKIIAYLVMLFLFFSLGAGISIVYIRISTSELQKIIELHSIEILRQDLIIKIQNVEKDLMMYDTVMSKNLDRIVSDVTDLDNSISICSGCHHVPAISAKIDKAKGMVEGFKKSLSYYITASADENRIQALKIESFKEGSNLVQLTEEMAVIANQKLQSITSDIIRDVKSAQHILLATLACAFMISLWVAVRLTRMIITPIRELITVSRRIASGNLGFKTTYSDSTEFGELASSFNDMSSSLEETNEKIVSNFNNLAGLYRITLPLHAITNIKNVFRELSYGTAEIIGVEQCGIMLLDSDGRFFVHQTPAFGLDTLQSQSIREKKEDVLSLYYARQRRTHIINESDIQDVPAGLQGGDGLYVRNMILGWVRQKGDLVGVIRLANKTEGDFHEEEARLIGIISNNVSVAVENIRLYEDLKEQMKELQSAQEQLVQAAKLAAIGELASNVAHEINNPLTSIVGYAELIKEETDLETIMKDIQIIEKESLRARDIVQELLTFSKKKPLSLAKIDLNNLLTDSVTLVSVPQKSPHLNIVEDYGNIPLIIGDPNQLKQVILNIMNNAIDAISDNGGKISIKTAVKDTNAIIEISDNGKGIPDEVLSRMFEPFFTTKKDKGTGLGLPITRKIIESHNGRLHIESIEGMGTRVTISLPVAA
ncbi:MAG: HAMP domain-containing protein [Nitrospiraceae bacterium]|nr:MAG: HAMP domain-containing protein [Nitrospiraceae bacterium]